MLNKIRLKLTLINSIVLAAVLIFTFIFVYILLDLNVISNTDNELCENAYQLKRFATLYENTSIQSSNAELHDEYLIYEHKMLSSSRFFGIWDSEENCLISQGNFSVPDNILSAVRDLIFTSQPQAERIIAETDGIYYIHSYSNQSFNVRICTTVFANDMGELRIAQTVSNMNDKNAVTTKLLNILIFAGILGVSVSFGIGYLLSGKAIAPIQQSIKRQKEFIADASHELRTPVTIMRTNLDVVMSSPDESVSSQTEWLDNAYKETTRMEKLINDMLLLAKADLNREKLNMEQIDAAELCRQAVERFNPIAEKKHISIHFNNQTSFSMINGDEKKLDQLLGIIIDNAITYSHNNSNIYVTIENDDNKNVILSIRDEGIGIDQNELEKIFKRFYRTDKARSRREGGTGLGLAIAQWIVQSHGGTITAQSVKNKGTVIITKFSTVEDKKDATS